MHMGNMQWPEGLHSFFAEVFAKKCRGMRPIAAPGRKVSAMKLKHIIGVAALGGFAYWVVKNSRAGTPTPDYRVIRKEGPIEIREYPRLTVVAAPMNGDDVGSSFRTLFQFITGENSGREKIEMTTPVLVQSGATGRRMAFIMPAQRSAESLPAPAEARTVIDRVDGGKFAALRFSGPRCSSSELDAADHLRRYLDLLGLQAKGEHVAAYYDPPWVPPFLRRNEVLIAVE
jgi:hypothetical protein